MNLRMHDQAPRQELLDDRAVMTNTFKKALTVFAAFIVVVMAFATITTTVTEVITAIDQPDFLVSPDTQDYMHKQGHGMIFNDMDMQ